MSPHRIQRLRTRGWRKPEGAVYVGRRSDWANPYRAGEPVHIETTSAWDPGLLYVYGPIVTPGIAVLLFRIWIADRLEEQIRDELAGRDLMCWCPLDRPCHADVLLEVANGTRGSGAPGDV